MVDRLAWLHGEPGSCIDLIVLDEDDELDDEDWDDKDNWGDDEEDEDEDSDGWDEDDDQMPRELRTSSHPCSYDISRGGSTSGKPIPLVRAPGSIGQTDNSRASRLRRPRRLFRPFGRSPSN